MLYDISFVQSRSHAHKQNKNKCSGRVFRLDLPHSDVVLCVPRCLPVSVAFIQFCRMSVIHIVLVLQWQAKNSFSYAGEYFSASKHIYEKTQQKSARKPLPEKKVEDINNS